MRRVLLLGLACSGLAIRQVAAYTAPQDHWIIEYERRWSVPSEPWGITIVDHQVAVTSGHAIRVYTEAGQFVTQWGGSAGSGNGTFNTPRGLDADAEYVYVADSGNHRIQVLTHAGAFVRKWGSSGTGAGQLSSPYGVAVDTNNVFVADTGNNRIQVFTKDGTFVRTWGQSGTLPGFFTSPLGLSLDTSNVYVADTYNRRVEVFLKDGTYVRHWAPATVDPGSDGFNRAVHGIKVDAGTVYLCWGTPSSWGTYSARFLANDVRGTCLYNHEVYWYERGSGELQHPRGIAVDGNRIFVADYLNKEVVPFRRIFRTLGTATIQSNDVPMADLVGVAQRQGTSILDIDFKVLDDNDATAAVYLLAFADTATDLTTVVPMTSLVEGTAAKTGANVTTNTLHRVSWDMSADWHVDYGDVRVAVLAKDTRRLVDIHFLHLPEVNGKGPLIISRTPLRDNDLLSLWFWLLASGNTAVRLDAGKVYGVGGTYDGQQLASGATTTAQGRAFLFEFLGLREATAAELLFAREATTPGTTTKWTFRDPNGTAAEGRGRSYDDRPVNVNEFGFDSGSTAGYWVVKPNP